MNRRVQEEDKDLGKDSMSSAQLAKAKRGLYVTGYVQDQAVDFLLDIGATETFISHEKYQQLLGAGLPTLLQKQEHVSLANGDPLEVTGRMQVKITLGGSALVVPVTVAHIACPAILGLDYLLMSGSVLDVPQLKLYCGGRSVPLRDEKAKPFLGRIMVDRTAMVPAGGEVLLSGKLEGWDDQPWTGIGLVETGRKNIMERGIMVAHLLVEAGQHVPVRVFNPSKLPVLLYKGTTIGELKPFDGVVEDAVPEMKRLGRMTDELGDRDAKQEVCPDHLVDLLERSCQHLNDDQSRRVKELLLKYKDVFSKGELDLGRTDLVRHSIDTGDHRPIKQPYRHLPVWQQQEAEKQIGDMLEKGVIEKSISPWASPIVLVKKKDGSTRFCIDYRRVNEITIKDAYPLPRIEDTFDALTGARWFSTLDLASGYWQVELEDEAKEKSAFAVRGGLYQWRVMPFGLCNAPATFERLMERILTGLHWEILLVYLDDVIIYGGTFDVELQRLETVFQRMRESKLKLKPKKCHLFQKKVAYLGHVVSEDGVSTDPEKIEAIKLWPVPGNQTAVRSFLGLASYYRRFIKGFAALAKPLHRLTEKNSSFHWTLECQEAFRNLKERLISAPILGFPALSIWKGIRGQDRPCCFEVVAVLQEP